MGEIVKVADKKDVPKDGGICVEANGKKIALFCSNGDYFAIDDTCTHAGGPLSEGSLSDKTVTCPWHGAEFDIATGDVKEGPAGENVTHYKVIVEGEDIKVELP